MHLDLRDVAIQQRLAHKTQNTRTTHYSPKPPTTSLLNHGLFYGDLLRGDFRQRQYGRVILPFCLLRRLECVLEPTKAAVLAEYKKVPKMNVPEEAQEKLLLRATNGLTFFNIIPSPLVRELQWTYTMIA